MPSLYLAVLVASFCTSVVTRAFRRKYSMLGGGITFHVGAAINGFARNVAMLIIGRILLGISISDYLDRSMPHPVSSQSIRRSRPSIGPPCQQGN